MGYRTLRVDSVNNIDYKMFVFHKFSRDKGRELEFGSWKFDFSSDQNGFRLFSCWPIRLFISWRFFLITYIITEASFCHWQ